MWSCSTTLIFGLALLSTALSTPLRDARAALADAPVHRCEACWRDPAREAGADAAASAVVHQMSALVASLRVWLVDVATGGPLREGLVSLHGDSGEAWRRAMNFLLRRGVLRPDPGHPMLSSPFPGG